MTEERGRAEGRLLILEGGDGTGKTTQALMIRKRLIARGRRVLHIREPGSTPVGERIRAILLGESQSSRCDPDGESSLSREILDPVPETEMLLYMACRVELFRKAIMPALDAGDFVILERSYFSTYAYQGAGLGIDPDLILRLGAWATAGVNADRVVLLDLEVEKSLARLGASLDRIERRGKDFHERVRQGYLDLARRYPDLVRVVSAEGSVDEVARRIDAELDDLY